MEKEKAKRVFPITGLTRELGYSSDLWKERVQRPRVLVQTRLSNKYKYFIQFYECYYSKGDITFLLLYYRYNIMSALFFSLSGSVKLGGNV